MADPRLTPPARHCRQHARSFIDVTDASMGTRRRRDDPHRFRERRGRHTASGHHARAHRLGRRGALTTSRTTAPAARGVGANQQRQDRQSFPAGDLRSADRLRPRRFGALRRWRARSTRSRRHRDPAKRRQQPITSWRQCARRQRAPMGCKGQRIQFAGTNAKVHRVSGRSCTDGARPALRGVPERQESYTATDVTSVPRARSRLDQIRQRHLLRTILP